MVTLNPWVFDALLWLQTLVTEWVGLVGGAVVGVVFLLYERVYAKQPLSYRSLLVGLWAAFILANFFAWRGQKTATDAANVSLQAQEVTNGELWGQLNNRNTPNFQASLQNVWMFKQAKNFELYMIVDVRNTGAPSIIDPWEAYIADRQGKVYVLPLHRIDYSFSFPTVNGQMKYKPSYWLPDRTLPNPVQSGADIKGILISIFGGPAVKNFNLHSIGISFTDVDGDTHWATNNGYTINSAAVSPPTLDR